MVGFSSMYPGNQALVVIITRTKDRPAFLRRAMISVLGQTFENWRHVIVNDGGPLKAVEDLAAEFSENYQGRVEIIHHPVSMGMEAASNTGINSSDSRYIVIHDDDDTWNPAFLEKCISYLERPPPALSTPIRGVATYSVRVLEKFDGEKIIPITKEPYNNWMMAVSLYRLASNNSIPPISFVFEREALDTVGSYREDLPVLGDWDFHLRFLAKYEIGLIREELANYHHRLDIKHGVAGNTVIAHRDSHLRYDQLIRNDLLRRDLEGHQLGLGFLVNVAQSFENLHRQLAFFSGVFQRLKDVPFVRWFYFKVMGS